MSPDSLLSWIAYLWLMTAAVIFAILMFVGCLVWGSEKAIDYSFKKWRERQDVQEE